MSSDDSIFSRINNLISYKVYQATTDPDAKRFADEQNAARKQQEAAAAAAATKKQAEEDAKKQQDSNYKKATYSTSQFVKDVVKYTTLSFMIFIFVLFAVYSGHLAANDAIGREVPYRILYFIYGALFCIGVVPYYLIQRLRGRSIKSYAILPIREGPVPSGIEGFFLSFISYLPDEESLAAKASWETAIKAASMV